MEYKETVATATVITTAQTMTLGCHSTKKMTLNWL